MEEPGIWRLPLLRALLAQALAVVLMVALVYLLALATWRLPLHAVSVAQGMLAALIGWRLGLSRWWFWINLAFVPALLVMLRLGLPAWVFLLAFAVLLLVNWNSVREQVPLYLSGDRAHEELAAWLQTREPTARFIDLGCGTGGTVLHLARRFPRGQFVGVETAPLLFVLAWLRCLMQDNCRIRYCSLWHTDLAEFDTVYCFLSPAPMSRLWAKARAEMTPGSWLISNSFAIAGVEPDRVVALNEGRQSDLLFWQVR